MTTTNESTATHAGGCHCGAVRFEADLDIAKGTMCNCSICLKLGTVGTVLKPAAFRLLQGADQLTSYEWGHKVAKRHFCKTCGVFCYGAGFLEMLGGDFVSVNLNTFDDYDPSKAEIGHWDGRHDNWQSGLRPTPWSTSQA